MNKKFPMYLPHPFGRDGKWAVSRYDGRGAWSGTSEAKSDEHARQSAKNANRRLRLKEKNMRQLGVTVSKSIGD